MLPMSKILSRLRQRFRWRSNVSGEKSIQFLKKLWRKGMDLQEEVDLMNKSLNEGLKEEEPPNPETPPEPPKEPEIPPIQVKDDKTPEPPKPPEEPSAPPTPSPVVDERDKKIADLTAEITTMKAELASKKEPPKPPEPPTPPTPTEQDFVGDMDLDEVTRDPKELNKVLSKVYDKARVDAEAGLMARLPDLIQTHSAIIKELDETKTQFFKDNEDLKPFQKVVATVFEEIMVKDPNRPYNEIIKDVAPEVRKRLNLKPPDKQPQPTDPPPEPPKQSGKDTPPKLPHAGSRAGRTEASPENSVQTELDAMNKSLGR